MELLMEYDIWKPEITLVNTKTNFADMFNTEKASVFSGAIRFWKGTLDNDSSDLEPHVAYNEPVAFLEIEAINETMCIDIGQNDLILLDNWYISFFHALSEYRAVKSQEEDFSIENTHIYYIKNLVVNPKYRGKGVGQYILDNFYDIVSYCFSASPQIVLAVPRPNAFSLGILEFFSVKAEELRFGDERKMLNIMVKKLSKSKYHKVSDASWCDTYIKTYDDNWFGNGY